MGHMHQNMQEMRGMRAQLTGDTATTMRMIHPMNRMKQQMHQRDMSNRNTGQNFVYIMVITTRWVTKWPKNFRNR